jgi:hypothetical protein
MPAIQDLENGLFRPNQGDSNSTSTSADKAAENTAAANGQQHEKNGINTTATTEPNGTKASNTTAPIPEGGGGTVTSTSTSTSTSELSAKIREALRTTFLETDSELLQYCTERGLHYASSTGVVVFLFDNLLTVAHVGDSKACIAKRVGDQLFPEWLTVDHKPNMPHELERIERHGGSLVWLHGNKPFIR